MQLYTYITKYLRGNNQASKAVTVTSNGTTTITPDNGYTSLKGIYSGKELMDKLAEYEFPPVETISAFSEDGLNQKLTEIQGWKNAGAELSYSVEEING